MGDVGAHMEVTTVNNDQEYYANNTNDTDNTFWLHSLRVGMLVKKKKKKKKMADTFRIRPQCNIWCSYAYF